jgi:hypothetical protein
VVALVAVAAVALRARQGLDWDHLSDPVEVRWARVLLAAVVLLLLFAVVRRLLRGLLRAASAAPQDDDEHAEPEGEKIPIWVRILFVLIVLATLAICFVVLASLGLPARPPLPPPPAAPQIRLDRTGADDAHDTGSTSTVLGLLAAALLVAAVAYRWLSARRERRAALAAEDDSGAEQRAEVLRLVEAVDAADEGLRTHADPRAAVLAAYAAMARHLSTGLAQRGRGLRRSDTAGELLDRAVTSGLVSGAPAGTLTALFREARFSTHPMGEDARASALASLAEVRAELGARRG